MIHNMKNRFVEPLTFITDNIGWNIDRSFGTQTTLRTFYMSELYEILRRCTDHTGLPVMKTSQFLHTIEQFGKEEFRKVLAEYITNEKPPFPLAEFNQEKKWLPTFVN